jgi:hypothetical protein
VNVDSPAIARLVDTTRPVDVNGPGTVLLRSLVPLLAGGGVLHQTGLADSLAEYTRIVTTLLDAEAP